jgi:superoxide dismutase, Cu-Zn family
MKKQISLVLFLGALSMSTAAQADTSVHMNMVDENGVGKEIGQVTISESQYGLVFSPAITGLPPGLHGFHVHENPSCEPKEKDGKKMPALAAGGHYDPANAIVRPGVTVTWGICLLCPLMPMAIPVQS